MFDGTARGKKGTKTGEASASAALRTLLDPVIGCATGQLHACGHMRRCHWPYFVCLI